MTQLEKLDLKNQGFIILKNRISEVKLDLLSKAIDSSFIQHKIIQDENNSDIKTEGVALHVLLNDDIFIKLLEDLIKDGFIQELQDNFFNSNCILNSLSALDNLPNKPNFSSNIHRDLRFYSGEFPVMLNCLIMIDDFTIENGGTFLLPGSHLEERKPSDYEFFYDAIQATGKRGDILVFNANVWHASAPNITLRNHRRAIPFTVSRSFMKQLLDYPRAIGYERINEFSPELQQLLGYHSRVPSSLIEWYQPEDKRFYKKNQD
jgi:ectoine hydroxylase-related dioxygenase (phytanoyl-CoA dioxygenase family)